MSSAGAPATEPELRCRRRNHAQAGATRTNVHPSSSLVRAGDAMVAGGRRRRATRDARQVDGAKARVRAAASTSSRPPPPSRIASPRLPVQAPCSPTISYARWSWRRHQDQLSKSVRARAIHKMGISGAVDWWEEWQLRILVLGSLFVQYLLLCSAPFRKFAIPSWYRSIIWLAYVGSDALAIYALATLFNRHRKDYGSANSNSVLEVVWAPVLLMHLGGQSAITAYNIEDNELWTRHILTAVSQVTVAIYVFCKSWPGSNKRLLQASILFFATGIYKCIQKPWALKRASINSLVSSSDPTPRMASMVGNTILLEEYVQEARDFVQGDKYRRSQVESDAVDLEHIHVPQAQGEAYELEDNHHHQAQGEGNNAAKLDLNHIPQINGKADVKMRVIKIREKERKFDLETRKIFVDLALSYPDRLDFLKYIWVLDKKKTCVFLRRGLFHTFDILYSRQTFNGHMELLREDAAAAQIRKEAAAVRKGSAAAAAEEESAAERSSGRKKRISTRKESAAERSSSRKKRIGTRKESAAAGAAAEVSFLDVFSYVLWAAAVYLPFTAIGLLHKSHREAYDVNDVKVTYALFCGTAVLEFLSGIFHLIVLCLSDLLILSGMVSQYSLVNFFVRNKRHSKKMCLLSSFNCKDFLDQRWCMKSCSSSFRITELVLGYVKCCWEKHIVDVASYRRFSDQRGQWTIQHKGCDQDQEWGLNRSFDESVLLWHIATDLCFYQKADTSACHVKATGCREISNYMIYLLFVKPEMLLPGTRRNLFKNANAELEKILKDDKPSLMAILKGNKPLLKFLKGKGPSPEETERRLVDRIIVKLRRTECREDLGCTEPPPDGERHPTAQQGSIHNTWQIFKSSLHTIIMQHIHFSPDAKKHPAAQERFIHDAWKLSELLLSLGDEKMWEVIEGVWVEMLCFSASRCRGYLHAKSLGTGGELLTHIWLLLSHMGMETLPERVQRRDLSSGGRNTGATPSSSKISTSTVEDMV